MKANITNVEKWVIPQWDGEQGADVDTLMVVVSVDFVKADGTIYLSQIYARRPEEFDAENPTAYFDAQADALQADIDNAEETKEIQQDSKKADDIINKITALKAKK